MFVFKQYNYHLAVPGKRGGTRERKRKEEERGTKKEGEIEQKKGKEGRRICLFLNNITTIWLFQVTRPTRRNKQEKGEEKKSKRNKETEQSERETEGEGFLSLSLLLFSIVSHERKKAEKRSKRHSENETEEEGNEKRTKRTT